MPISKVLLLLLAPACVLAANFAPDGQAQSWETRQNLPQVNDSNRHTYAYLPADRVPVDVGIEWNTPHRIASVVIRYFDARMARSPNAARTQDWGRLQYWTANHWVDLASRRYGTELASARYTFDPVATTRIRFLISEPPDPEARRAPGRLGIAVCEFEAYDTPPFTVIPPSPGVVKSQHRVSYLRNYNEAAAGDSSYEIPGPVVIEPIRSAVFHDTLEPTLVPADLPEARQSCRVIRGANSLLLENGFLRVRIDPRSGREESITNRLTQESVRIPAQPAVRSSMEIAGCEVRITSDNPLKVIHHYSLETGDPFYRQWLSYTNDGPTPADLEQITVSSIGLPATVDLMAGQELTYPIYRTARGGLFQALETPYWDHRGDALTYYPGVLLQPGATYQSVKAVLGIFRNRGEAIAGWDRGLREWIIAYHDRISPVAPEWPEAYTEGWTADLSLQRFQDHPAQIEHFFRVAHQLGIGYADTYEPSHQAIPLGDPILRNFVDLADRYHVGTGWWNDFGADNSWNNTVIPRKPLACKLSPEAEQFFAEVVASAGKYHLRAMHWADFFTIWPCNETGHGHLPGKYSIFAQGQRMLRFARDLKQASPGILLGADGGFTNPQLVRYTDGRGNAWFVDSADKFSAMEPDIHLDRLTAERNRVYAYGAHMTNLIPWARLLNWVNHFGYVSHLHDHAGFRYALLSAFAMAPQLTYNDIPDEMPEDDVRFVQKWFAWARANAGTLRYGDKLFDRSIRFADIWQGDADSLSGFAHIRKDRGFLFFENPTPVEQTAELKVNLPGEQFAFREIYPSDASQTVRGGGLEKIRVPAKQVVIIQVAPGTTEARTAPASPKRYVDNWSVVRQTSQEVILRSHFSLGDTRLDETVPAADWSQNPWGYRKAYLVLLLQDETGELNDHLVSDKLPVHVKLNGREKLAYAFQSKRYTIEGKTRCFFVEITDPDNQAEISLPMRPGLVFQGAWVDVPE